MADRSNCGIFPGLELTTEITIFEFRPEKTPTTCTCHPPARPEPPTSRDLWRSGRSMRGRQGGSLGDKYPEIERCSCRYWPTGFSFSDCLTNPMKFSTKLTTKSLTPGLVKGILDEPGKTASRELPPSKSPFLSRHTVRFRYLRLHQWCPCLICLVFSIYVAVFSVVFPSSGNTSRRLCRLSAPLPYW